MPKVKRERTDDTYDEDHASMKPSKKIKKEKVSVEDEKAAYYAARSMDDSTRADENGEQDAMTYEEKLAFVNAIAKPMATKKFTKKLYKLIKKASKHRGYILTGLKEVQTKIRKDHTGLIILAGDVHPIDIFSHIPGICEEKGIPYIFTPSRRDMATAMGMRRPLIILMVKEHDDYKDLMDECAEVIRNEYIMV
ncbi:NHP2 ribonucleoprotein [Haemaphysalis longicornis]|uniref:Ribosomal protein eL8/eL30/eS12/Gadd45 domain-containing protein n=1 Tax=Haemaphysalis longicornis TaxID=44386 RepID=A0A9J6F7E0_HAELO|nr:hypothetical protein HPB48_003729 [Haemaphysalis longicornis]